MYVDPKLYAAEELANAIIIKAVEDYRKAMTRKYTFTTKDIEIIKKARKKNKDKRAEKRLHALQLRAEGKRAKEIAEEVGVSAPYVSQLAAKYFAGGIEAIAGNHYGGNRRNMSVEEEEAILKPFYERAEKSESSLLKSVKY